MAINETVYSPSYPSNTKTVTIDMVKRIPVGNEGDEKYILYVYTSAYSNNTNRTSIDHIYISDLRRGWAQSHELTSPITTVGGTLTVAIDEADSGALSITVTSGTYTGPLLAEHIEEQIKATASGSKASASNYASYRDCQVSYEDARLTLIAGSIKTSYNASTWMNTSSVKVTGGTVANELGFYSGYPNSYDLTITTSGYLHGPASAITSLDDAVRYAVDSIANQIDFTS